MTAKGLFITFADETQDYLFNPIKHNHYGCSTYHYP
jgi:hypothetical protein